MCGSIARRFNRLEQNTENRSPSGSIQVQLQEVPLLPARMVNEYRYCPRLAYLEWVQGEWMESADTVQGRHRHRRVNKPEGKLPEPEDVAGDDKLHARSITLSSEKLGIIARMDLIEARGKQVTPVDYKRGKRPHVTKGAYEPELVQLCVQGLLLEEHGYECIQGVLYFCSSRERVKVVFDDDLRRMTLETINDLRTAAARGKIPPPLEDSPKCPRCSLVGICLPDEINYWNNDVSSIRPMFVTLDEALPLYVQTNGARITKDGETIRVYVDDEMVQKVRLIDLSQLVIMGNAYLTTPCLRELMQREIPVSWHSYGGWFTGHTVGIGHKNVEVRTAQYRGSFDERLCLKLARGFVAAKIRNSRTLLRRNWKQEQRPDQILDGLNSDQRRVGQAKTLEELLGHEGAAASRYFKAFSGMLKTSGSDAQGMSFDFKTRNRRPPTDPVNALLSYAYALLTRTLCMTLSAVGLDPYRGFYHQPRYGRPALALDLMEAFRPLIADSTVIQVINNQEVRTGDFVRAGGGVNLKQKARKKFIAAYERRLGQEITHPVFGYKISYRRLLEVQSRLLGRFLLGELPEYPNLTTR
jgi:CRISP-associated protein Cas1